MAPEYLWVSAFGHQVKYFRHVNILRQQNQQAGQWIRCVLTDNAMSEGVPCQRSSWIYAAIPGWD